MAQNEIAIATRDPKALYHAVKILKGLKIGFTVCAPNDFECDIAKVVITTEAEESQNKDGRTVLVGTDPDPDSVTIDIMIRLLEIYNPTCIVIGVDPGMRFGLALVIDGKSVHTRNSSSPIDAVKRTLSWIDHMKRLYHDSVIIVKVGTGSPLYSALYLRGIFSRGNVAMVELVNEQHTTFAGSLHSDQSSASMIAARHGRTPSESDVTLEPKDGHVRSLKRLVARITDGSRSLTTEEAQSVLVGTSSLESIINGVA
jgi:hypothetical protein